MKSNIVENNLKIIKISSIDVLRKTDKYFDFHQLIHNHEIMYPDIMGWLKNKVEPGIKDNSRIAYVGYNNEKPVISAITKIEDDTKFCHLYIDLQVQNMNVGDLFFAMMTLDVKDKAKNIHFTLPESLWEQKKEFFNSFGFTTVEKAGTQYRLFDQELKCEAQYSTVFKNVLEKLPKIISTFSSDDNEIFNGLLLSIKPKYVDKIKSREKVIELRRKFSTKWIGSKIVIYSSSPTKALLGNARIGNVIKDKPINIWNSYNGSLGCSEEEFFSYAKGTDEIFAIIIDEFKEYYNPLYLSQLQYLLKKEIKPPQSYSALINDKEWTKAVSIAELLHGRFNYRIIV